jgi:hypothetical protein
MPQFSISYKIDDAEINPEEVTDWYEIGGGMCVKYGDIILTRSNAKDDDGYIGNWVFNEILALISRIPRLMRGEKCIVDIEELFTGFSMEPKNNQIYFSVIPMHLEPKIAEEAINMYPRSAKACPIPAKLFYNGVIDLGHRFLNDIKKMYINFNKKEIENYRELLKDAEELVDEYNKTH